MYGGTFCNVRDSYELKNITIGISIWNHFVISSGRNKWNRLDNFRDDIIIRRIQWPPRVYTQTRSQFTGAVTLNGYLYGCTCTDTYTDNYKAYFFFYDAILVSFQRHNNVIDDKPIVLRANCNAISCSAVSSEVPANVKKYCTTITVPDLEKTTMNYRIRKTIMAPNVCKRCLIFVGFPKSSSEISCGTSNNIRVQLLPLHALTSIISIKTTM